MSYDSDPRMMSFWQQLESLSLSRISGPSPEVWFSLGTGWVREDLKAFLFTRGKGFCSHAVTSPEQLALALTGLPPEALLTDAARQDFVRVLFSEPQMALKIPELRKLRRQKNFFQRLDRSLQAGRLAFSHPEEASVYEQRLRSFLPERAIRRELEIFSHGYEAGLATMDRVDLPCLFRKVIRCLESSWPAFLPMPKEIWNCSQNSNQRVESLEKSFWEALQRWVPIQVFSTLDSMPASGVFHSLEGSLIHPSENHKNKFFSPFVSLQSVSWQRWHTLDDAAEAFVDQCFEFIQQYPQEGWDTCAVLLPDIRSVRWSLLRVLKKYGVPLADAQDPTYWICDESIKWALLPIEVVAYSFERQRVITWLNTFCQEPVGGWIEEINQRAIRNGLESYMGEPCSQLYQSLCELQKNFGGKKTLAVFSKNHIDFLEQAFKTWEIQGFAEKAWEVLEFFQQLWADLEKSWTRMGVAHRTYSALFWMEQLRARIQHMGAPVTPVRNEFGLRLYRPEKVPFFVKKDLKKVWIFGLTPDWLEDAGGGDFWFTRREREILATEFAVNSSSHQREERLQLLKNGFSLGLELTVLDALYDSHGKERSSLRPLMHELDTLFEWKAQAMTDDTMDHESALGSAQRSDPSLFLSAFQECGAHPRLLKSYGVSKWVHPQTVQLSPIRPSLTEQADGKSPEITASVLDSYTRCSFQALAFHRWKLKDLRKPAISIWPEVRGIFLHRAVLEWTLGLEKTEQGWKERLTPQEAVQRVWKKQPPRGVFHSPSIEGYLKYQFTRILNIFCEKERAYLNQSGVQPLRLDDYTLCWKQPGYSIVGRPDRIDQHAEGLWIMDYKSSNSFPHLSEMLESGYRLQLAFYALALREDPYFSSSEVLGAQWVGLNRYGSRNSGIFPPQLNGKKPGQMTQVQARSQSLMQASAEEVWDQLKKWCLDAASGWLNGVFEARPRSVPREKECYSCRVTDLCGLKRCLK